MARRGGEPLAAVALGALSGVAEALFLIVAVVVWASPGRRVVSRHARALAGWERRRLALPPAHTPDDRRVLAFLAARLVPAFLGAVTAGLLLLGLVLVGIVTRAFVTGQMSPLDLLAQFLIGSALLALNVQAVGSVLRLDRWLARVLLEPGSRGELEQRITELTATRAGVIAAVDAERRRIERDLHDGLQQRLVALGMLLGRARRSRDPDQAARLLTQAHQDAQRAIDELREVAWRVYPSALDHGTLDDALSMVARRSTVPVRISYRLDERPAPQVETVLYFVACEAITNAAKHSAAKALDITIAPAATASATASIATAAAAPTTATATRSTAAAPAATATPATAAAPTTATATSATLTDPAATAPTPATAATGLTTATSATPTAPAAAAPITATAAAAPAPATAAAAATTATAAPPAPAVTAVEMVIRDDGRGGADPTGSGLEGLARRVAALDGHFDLRSPLGAGTTIRVVLPNQPAPPEHFRSAAPSTA